MACEAKRGCGYREVGGLYLVADGIWVGCDRLPFPIGHCPVCNEGMKFPRAPREINPARLFGEHQHCTDEHRPNCSVCQPKDDIAYLLGVGEKFYKRPGDFVNEALAQGVSKRIPAVPKNLIVGKTRVYLVHKAAMFDQEDRPQLAIFAAFTPQRLEMPIYESDLTDEKRAELEKRGITPVPIQDGDPDHAPRKRDHHA